MRTNYYRLYYGGRGAARVRTNYYRTTTMQYTTTWLVVSHTTHVCQRPNKTTRHETTQHCTAAQEARGRRKCQEKPHEVASRTCASDTPARAPASVRCHTHPRAMPCSRRDGSVLCHGELHAALVVQHQPRSPGSVSKHRRCQTCSRDRLCSVCGLPAPGSKQQGRGERTAAPDLLGPSW